MSGAARCPQALHLYAALTGEATLAVDQVEVPISGLAVGLQPIHQCFEGAYS